jgi:hypothetical protein
MKALALPIWRRSQARVLPVLLTAACLCLGSCDLPRDPEQTLSKVASGMLRVGTTGGDSPTQLERKLVEQLASELDSTVLYVPGETHELVDALSRGELQLVVSLPASTPFEKHVGFSRTYRDPARPRAERVFAIRAGENAWLLAVNRQLAKAAHPE